MIRSYISFPGNCNGLFYFKWNGIPVTDTEIALYYLYKKSHNKLRNKAVRCMHISLLQYTYYGTLKFCFDCKFQGAKKRFHSLNKVSHVAQF